MSQETTELILVADDDKTSRQLLVRTLSGAGFTCIEAADGIEAMKSMRNEKPSLLLLDFDMPGMDGAEVVKQVRRDDDPTISQVPTIMLTGHGSAESEVLCLDAGADDFVTKPINLAILRARIETQLRLRSMRRQLQQQKDELEAWRQNLELDLAAARLTQQSLIPQKPPSLPGWDIASCYLPVIQVGGDIFGWLRMADTRTLFWIADATGHGASAALLTTLAKLLFHHAIVEQNAPVEIMEAVNNDFRNILGARSFMTAMCVALEPETGLASVVGAGHPPLLVARHTGQIETIYSSAPPLGLRGNSRFLETTFALEPEDAFLLYTDGLYGPRHAENPRAAAERLGKLLYPPASSARDLLARLIRRPAANIQPKSSADDIAAVAARRSPETKSF